MVLSILGLFQREEDGCSQCFTCEREGYDPSAVFGTGHKAPSSSVPFFLLPLGSGYR